MKTNEFLKLMSDNDFTAAKDGRYLVVNNQNSTFFASIDLDNYTNLIINGTGEMRNKRVLNAIFEYAMTPIEDRKELYSMFLRNMVAQGGQQKVCYDLVRHEYFVGAVWDNPNVKTLFTLDECEELKEILSLTNDLIEIKEFEG